MTSLGENELVPRKVQVAIIGSGPGGLSAAARAAENGLSYILLEAEENISNTIFLYQKGKPVMDEPGILPLRSSLEFKSSSREEVLSQWNKQLEELKIKVQFKSEVIAIEGKKGDFKISLKDGKPIQAETIVLAIGMQGNLRKLGVEGEDLSFVQYQLSDPEEYEDETIVVIGAGDAAIENAIALSKQNQVIIVNRKDEFSRAKDGNLTLITQAIERGKIECYYNSAVDRVEVLPTNENQAGVLILNTEEGSTEISVHRIIARLGAVPPRRFLESLGIIFPSKDPESIPEISASYESNVPGLFIVGALGGNPLIKQAMNQGYEVIEHIQGNPIKPADEQLLQKKIERLSAKYNVSETLEAMQKAVPLLASLTTLQLRELMMYSEIILPQPGATVYKKNDYTNTFYSLVAGKVSVYKDDKSIEKPDIVRRGNFFGEWSLISGRRRSETVVAGQDVLLVETSRRAMLKLIASVQAVQEIINKVSILRTIEAYLAPGIDHEILTTFANKATIEIYKAGELILKEEEVGDSFHIIRSGSVTETRKVSGRDVVVAYLPVGSFVGQVAIFSDLPCNTNIVATVSTETIRIDKETFKDFMVKVPQVRLKIEASIQQRLKDDLQFLNHPETGEVVSFMMQQGLGEATDVLLIDESLCVHCDNCETACAATHGGVSRLDREAGPSFGTMHIPTSCRHCEHPSCMKDCPPDAIHRAENGEVYIKDSCIGCGNCERNCPYDVIHMDKLTEVKTNLFSSIFFGKKTSVTKMGNETTSKKAVKCDMCKDLSGGSACVRACPTGAAIRIGPEEIIKVLS